MKKLLLVVVALSFVTAPIFAKEEKATNHQQLVQKRKCHKKGLAYYVEPGKKGVCIKQGSKGLVHHGTVLVS